MDGKTLWQGIRRRAYIVFPLVSIVLVAVILASPLFPWPFSMLHSIAFVRFCAFWCLGVCMVLAACDRPLRPAFVATIATLISIAICVVFFLVYSGVLGYPPSPAKFVFSCLSGSILGTLAGTWGIYVFEVYAGGR